MSFYFLAQFYLCWKKWCGHFLFYIYFYFKVHTFQCVVKQGCKHIPRHMVIEMCMLFFHQLTETNTQYLNRSVCVMMSVEPFIWCLLCCSTLPLLAPKGILSSHFFVTDLWQCYHSSNHLNHLCIHIKIQTFFSISISSKNPLVKWILLSV